MQVLKPARGSREEELELFHRWRTAGDEGARLRLMECHGALVVKLALRFRGAADLDDLISEGNIAVMLAIDRFDTTRGFLFSTFAKFEILREMQRLCRSIKEIPMDTTMYLAPDTRPLADEMMLDAEDEVLMNARKADLREATTLLTAREHEVITARYLTDPPMAIADIAKGRNVTRGAVHACEMGSISKLRAWFKKHNRKILAFDAEGT